MHKFPTQLARQLMTNYVQARCERDVYADEAIAAFQRLAAVGQPVGVCVTAMHAWWKPNLLNVQHTSPEWKAYEMVHSIVKEDLLGHAIQTIHEIATGAVNASGKDKLTAATVMNELFGEKELIKDEVLTDRLVINLVDKD